jgi:2-C-methyl-D-erythritol 4-phosphate cytidylyltransferase
MDYSSITASVIIVAAGRGERFKSAEIPKAFFPLCGKPILSHTLSVFEKTPEIKEIIVVLSKEYRGSFWDDFLKEHPCSKIKTTAEGGKTRADSVWSGLSQVSKNMKIVLVHDAARPLVQPVLVSQIIQEASRSGGCIPGVKIKPTLKEVNTEGFIVKTHDREKLWEAQTPQGFQLELIMTAYLLMGENRASATDEAFAAEKAGMKVKMLEGDAQNIKITTREDLHLAELWLSGRSDKEKI